MKAAFSLFLVLLFVVPISCRAERRPADERTAMIGLLQRLVSALNTRDAAIIRAFLETNATPDVPLDARVERMAGFAAQGAPFDVEAPTVTAQEVSAILVDREHIRLRIAIVTTGGETPKLKSAQVRPLQAPAGPDPALDRWRDLHELAGMIARKRRVPALGVAVCRNGRMETTSTGIRKVGDRAAVTADEPWSIGSIGKPICSTIVALLIEQGKLRWNETLGEALPDVPMQPGYRAVTLEQIMQHRGGIPQDPGFRIDRVRQIVGDAKTPLEIRRRYVRDILGRAPIGRPGERSAYSNAGYALLGHIAEWVTGKPYERLCREMVFAPLHLKHSYTGADTLPGAMPRGHVPGPGGPTEANMSGPLEFMLAPAGGGLYMSMADLATFGREHLKGLRGRNGLLRAATVARLHRGLPEGDGAFLYACGWGIEPNPGIETFHGHNGSNGTFRAQLAIFPRAGLVIAAAVNCGGEEEPSPCLEAALAIARRYARP